jgi:hypothetical protein
MTAAQEKEMRSKKRTQHVQTEEEKWSRIYRILFGWDLAYIPSSRRSLPFFHDPFPSS